MLEKIAKIADRYDELERKMALPEVLADYARLAELAQERTELQPIVGSYHQRQALAQDIADTRELLELSEEDDFSAMAEEEILRLEQDVAALDEEMRRLLIPRDPRDHKNVLIEIRAGAGGNEAAIFAADLARLYSRYSEAQKWRIEIVDSNAIGIGGYKEVILAIKGKGAFSRLKFESGVHRVQRVPTTESQGRIHTSTATVAVMPEVQAVEVTLDERELEITSTFASGPGGQHMQKNATAIRIVHKPTGLSVKVQSERSQTQNKRLAMAIIQTRLQEDEEARQSAATAADRKAQVGSGDRSEKIRTYNYPQGRVTDHRIGFTSYNLPAVMDGYLDDLIEALSIADQAAKLAAIGSQ